MNDSDDYRSLLECLFEDDGDDVDDICFHNSFPAHSRGSGVGVVKVKLDDHFARWASNSDPEIGRSTTLDDMLREDAVSRRNVPRPVRQRSLEGPTFEGVLSDDTKDRCPTLVQRQRTFSFDGL